MSSPKHTPLPWANRHFSYTGWIRISSAAWPETLHDAMIKVYPRTSPLGECLPEHIDEATANAELLVRAVNSHHALVDCLEKVWRSILLGHLMYDKDVTGTIAQQEMIKATLALAKGEDASKLFDSGTAQTQRELMQALGELFAWAQLANSRLAFEQKDGLQFGGNPYLNPLFKKIRTLLGDK